jgi:hypothetical protein
MHKWGYWLVGMIIALAAVAPARAGRGLDEAGESAAWLIRKALLAHRDGRHNLLLRTLRQMRDPRLEPLFAACVVHDQPAMQFHGVLGLAELSAQRKVDLALIADLKDPLTQAQIIGAALESNMLDLAQCRQILDSPGYDTAVRLVVATKLAAEGQLASFSAISEAERSEKPAVRGMWALLKLQSGDSQALSVLRSIDETPDRNRDEIRAMLLQTAGSQKLSAVGPWALEIAAREREERAMAYLGLRVAMQFKTAGAAELWARRLAAARDDPADRIRLALMAADIAPQLDPDRFEALISDSDPVVSQLGRTGRALAAAQPPEKEFMKLLELNHNVSSQWVLQQARRLPITQGRAVLVALILNAEGEPNPPLYRGQRLDGCVFATEHLAENDSASHEVLGSILRSSPALTQEAMLMGLLRARIDTAHRLVEGISFESEVARAMALLIRARDGVRLEDEEMRRLALLVQGVLQAPAALRLQAGWIYLKITDQDRFALAGVLGK